MNRYLPEGRLFEAAENRRLLSSPAGLKEAQLRGTVLEGMVTRCDSSRALHVNCGGSIGIIPWKETALGAAEGRVREIAVLSLVGRPVSFFVDIVEDSPSDPRILLSRRRVQQAALDCLTALAPGTVIPATVTRLERFGAFVDVGCGLPSLIPIDRISTSRIPHAACRFVPGQEIQAIYLGREATTGHILLSHRELLGSWEQNAALFSPGEAVPGIVRGVKDYGIFIELTPNLSGLSEPREGLAPGDRVTVYIKSISPEKHKLKLAIIGRLPPRSLPDPLHYFPVSPGSRPLTRSQ